MVILLLLVFVYVSHGNETPGKVPRYTSDIWVLPEPIRKYATSSAFYLKTTSSRVKKYYLYYTDYPVVFKR